MPKTITVGRRLIPHAHVAYVEPFDAGANPDFHPPREFHARVVMVNRDDTMLIEETPQSFAASNGFRMLNADRIATNPAVRFRVESFLPTEGFTPAKAYATRLLWRDLDGNEQSKLLLSEPETVLRVAVEGEADEPLGQAAPKRVRRRGQAAENPVTLAR